MTTAENVRATVARADAEIRIAGVPWPAYKLAALAVGVLVLLVVGVATLSPAPAVLAGAAAATVVWLAAGVVHTSRR
jgi:hypothetical protein